MKRSMIRAHKRGAKNTLRTRHSRFWKAYLPINATRGRIRIKKADVKWFAERGIDRHRLAAALTVMHHVRYDVLPLCDKLSYYGMPAEISFLVHDRASGVPAPRGGRRAYLDLTIGITVDSKVNIANVLSKKYKYVKPYAKEEKMAYLMMLSAWYIELVESCGSKVSDAEVLKVVGQHAHYLANMTQMVIR